MQRAASMLMLGLSTLLECSNECICSSEKVTVIGILFIASLYRFTLQYNVAVCFFSPISNPWFWSAFTQNMSLQPAKLTPVFFSQMWTNAGATRAACVPRRVRTPQAPTSACAPLVFAYPAMARTVKVCVCECKRFQPHVRVCASSRMFLELQVFVLVSRSCMREHDRFPRQEDFKAGPRTTYPKVWLILVLFGTCLGTESIVGLMQGRVYV